MSSTRPSRSSRQDGAEDVGTLWTMHRREHSARCALIARRTGWEVRVLIGRDSLLEERCDRADEAFSIGERWRVRLLEDGWQQVVPPSRDRGSLTEPPLVPLRRF
jgi:hypothetical protein